MGLNAPTLDLLAASDSNVTDDNITNIPSMTFHVTNVVSGATVKILSGTEVLGQAAATRHQRRHQRESDRARATGLPAEGGAEPEQRGQPGLRRAGRDAGHDRRLPRSPRRLRPAVRHGSPVTYDAQNPEEGTSGLTYALVNAPAGATINAATGVLSWTPTTAQGGLQSFQIKAADAAGNATTQNAAVTVAVVDQKVRIRLATADTSGSSITHVASGQDFLLQAFVQDLRTGDAAEGVFAAYLDVNYDPGPGRRPWAAR